MVFRSRVLGRACNKHAVFVQLFEVFVSCVPAMFGNQPVLHAKQRLYWVTGRLGKPSRHPEEPT